MIDGFKAVIFRSDAFTSAVYVGSSAIIGLMLVSLSLNYIGPEIYGLWVLLQAAMFVGMMSEQGLGLAIIRVVSNDGSSKDQDLVATSFVAAVIVSTVFLSIIIGVNASFTSYASEVVNNTVYLEYILPTLGITTVFMILGVIPCAVLTGMKKLYLVNLIKTMARMLQLISASTLFYFGYSLWSLVISLLVYQFSVFSLSALALVKKFNYKTNPSASYQPAIFDELWAIGSKIMLARIIGLGIDPLFKFTLGSVVGLSYVTFYDLAFKIVSLVSQVPVVALKGRMAGYKELLRVGNGSIVKKSMKASDFSIALYLVVAFLIFYFGLELFLKLWLSSGYDPLISMTVLFLIPPLSFYAFAHSRELLLITSGDAMTSLRAYITQGFLLPVFMGILLLSTEPTSYKSLLVCYGSSHIIASGFIWRNYRTFLKSLVRRD